jgi:hypothetical protein
VPPVDPPVAAVVPDEDFDELDPQAARSTVATIAATHR